MQTQTKVAQAHKGFRAHASSSLAEAVKSVAKPDSRVLICGSLYLAGRVLEENG